MTNWDAAVEAAHAALQALPCSFGEVAAEMEVETSSVTRWRDGERGMRGWHAKRLLEALDAIRSRRLADAESLAELTEPIRKALEGVPSLDALEARARGK